jgi:hypothetical protein
MQRSNRLYYQKTPAQRESQENGAGECAESHVGESRSRGLLEEGCQYLAVRDFLSETWKEEDFVRKWLLRFWQVHRV